MIIPISSEAQKESLIDKHSKWSFKDYMKRMTIKANTLTRQQTK